ncbi:hypothetical protein KOI35_28230 [Actinoplanes bogorensis]|uniref:Uncharacterized protein n=1 Tax=Paractinoplanes bogorensis TaxID=1610840 RepID=A0ABS5YVC3_9ACTN|nr:hypothetical protein [Actinoplanes bogorensis]MBU2667406.1 hypothetical protein [Actinoplanes bogorensis]
MVGDGQRDDGQGDLVEEDELPHAAVAAWADGEHRPQTGENEEAEGAPSLDDELIVGGGGHGRDAAGERHEARQGVQGEECSAGEIHGSDLPVRGDGLATRRSRVIEQGVAVSG